MAINPYFYPTESNFTTYEQKFMEPLLTACYNIKKVRTIRGLKQQDLADKLNINLKSYQNIENGITRLDIERLNQISEILDVTIFDLLKQEGLFINQEIQHNTSVPIYNKDVTINNDIAHSERKLFEKMIEDKDREIAFLRDQLSKKK